MTTMVCLSSAFSYFRECSYCFEIHNVPPTYTCYVPNHILIFVGVCTRCSHLQDASSDSPNEEERVHWARTEFDAQRAQSPTPPDHDCPQDHIPYDSLKYQRTLRVQDYPEPDHTFARGMELHVVLTFLRSPLNTRTLILADIQVNYRCVLAKVYRYSKG